MSNIQGRKDRTARLLKLQILLWQHPEGLNIHDIAQICACSKRTIYRDLIALESDLGVPVWEDRSKRGLGDGYFLPPVNITLTEAMSIFLALRLMQKYSYVYNSSIASTFMKLNTIVPSPLKEHIQNILLHLEKQTHNDTPTANLYQLAQAWLTKHKVKIRYKGYFDKEEKEYFVDPYFIEPSALRHSNYLIAYCPLEKAVKTFKIERIIGNVEIQADVYEIPANFNMNEYTSMAWGNYGNEKVETVRLRFNRVAGDAIMKTIWHPTQVNEVQPDGSIIVTIKVHDILGLGLWILGWGYDVQVLEPKLLRDQIVKIAKSILCSNCEDGLNNNHLCSEVWRGTRDMTSAEITDKQWEEVKAIMPPYPTMGRPRTDDRNIINGILWKLKTGARWAEIPPKYGAVSTCHARFKSWQESGVLKDILRIFLQAEQY